MGEMHPDDRLGSRFPGRHSSELLAPRGVLTTDIGRHRALESRAATHLFPSRKLGNSRIDSPKGLAQHRKVDVIQWASLQLGL